MLFIDAEKKAIGITHNEIGSWLATKWNLPDDLSASILYHHTPVLATKHRTMVYAVHAADILARSLNIGAPGDKRIPVFSSDVWDDLKFSRQLIDKIYRDIEYELEKSAIFFQIM